MQDITFDFQIQLVLTAKKNFPMKYILLFISLLITQSVFGQDDKRPNFWGVNPSVTVEPFYEKGEFDINILPLIYQTPLTKRFDFRLISTLNLAVRNDGNGISHVGLQAGLPMYFKAKESQTELSRGLFIAPIVSLGRNHLEQHNSLGLWVEPGYNLLFDNDFAMTFGLQFGGTYFPHEDGQTQWGNHFGVIIVFGKWF